MKFAVGQMRVIANQPSKNLETMLEMIADSEGKADIIVFPEMCIGGYFVADAYQNHAYQEALLSYNQGLIDMSATIGIVWGNIDCVDGVLYNAAYFAYEGKLQGVYHKALLPNYGVFDDKRYFESGANFEPFVFKGKKLSLQICEDLWDEGASIYPTRQALEYMPDYIVNISCSPWVKGKEDRRTKALKRNAVDIPFIYVNSVGTQNTGKNVVTLDGDSQVIVAGHHYHLNDCFTQELAIVDVEQFEPKTRTTPKDKVHAALIYAIQSFDAELLSYRPQWVIGVSGGLDSSVSAALLTQALGKDRVTGVTMPSKFTRDITKSNAGHLSKVLGFKLLEIPIGEMVDRTVAALQGAHYERVDGLAYENIQARLRGHTLMSVASLENGVVVNNGNKIETALGYATLYGDAIGALSILGDLTKLEVGALAQAINIAEGKEVIPNNLIPQVLPDAITWDFAPSAELSEGQFDPMKWGYHDYLIPYLMKHAPEDVLEHYQDSSIYELQFGPYLDAYGLNDPEAFIKDLEWVVRLMRQSVYKRIQTPPIILMSDCGYGTDYRESQLPNFMSDRYIELKESIMKQKERTQ